MQPVQRAKKVKPMPGVFLRYTQSGHVFISPKDDPVKIASALEQSGYEEEFCIARDFGEDFIARLMSAGFMVMSAKMETDSGDDFILLPKLHLERSVIIFPAFRESKSIVRLIPRYELKAGADFGRILDGCKAAHGDDWLTTPLVKSITSLQARAGAADMPAGPLPFSFALYRNGSLAAGEFGVISGKVYTSYSGFHAENSAGTVQMILTARWLRERNFAFWDLGMPMDYKTRLGAQNISRGRFLELFREAAI
jgi:Leu/Phe-tRNA-protein transferase